MLRFLRRLVAIAALALGMPGYAAYGGFHFDQTNFEDGWTSVVKLDWVEVTRGTMKVLLHYPREGTIVPGDPGYKLANAWNILVAPRYSNLQNWFVAETITSFNADDVASASVQELATGDSKYVVLFRRTGYWMEFVAPDKATFMQNFQNIDINTVTWQSPLTTYDVLDAISGKNYFAVHPTDLSGEWTNSFGSMQNYYNIYTGSAVGTYTYNSYLYFNYKPNNAYDWKIQVVAGYEGQYGYQEANSSGVFSVPNPWQIDYSWIENGAKSYDVYYSAIKDGRLLWMRDRGFVGNGTFTPYGKSATNTGTLNNQSIGTISFSPTSLSVGSTTTVSATATSSLPVTFTSSTGSVCTVSGSTVTGVSAGSCTIAADQAGDATYAAAPQVTQNITVTVTASNPPRLLNIATRGRVETVDNVMIAGFIIQGSSPKKVLIRARGPSLAAAPFNVPGTLSDPFLTLYSGATPIDSNDDFALHANAAQIPADWIPANAKEAAIVTTLNPGAYTAIVNGVGATSGVAIVEVFEIDQPGAPLINIATRGPVYTGDNVMIAGLIIQGDAPKTVLITARGPSMAGPPHNVPGTLANPTLTLYSGQTVIGTNDNWTDAANAAQIQTAIGAPSNTLESAILVTLQPGAYTAIVSGAGGGTGLAIVEVFAQ